MVIKVIYLDVFSRKYSPPQSPIITGDHGEAVCFDVVRFNAR